MARGTARLGDRTSGVCSIHGPIGGSITSVSGDVNAESKGVARLGDTVTADCGHTGNISSASGDTYVNSKPVARLGDSVSGTYSATIITASGTVNING